MPKVCKTKIFFTSGGGYWTYYLGVAAYIQENYNLESCEFAGVSAGGMAAYILASGMNVREAWEKYYVPYTFFTSVIKLLGRSVKSKKINVVISIYTPTVFRFISTRLLD